MSYFPHGAIIAAQQSQQKKIQQDKEEEEMTKYSIEDLENDWEFKIVRSSTNAFRDPAIFQSLLQEEEISGWTLVEKLDDNRVRFKRRRDSRRRDASLPSGVDPYRTQFGPNNQTVRVALVAVLSLLLGSGVLAMVLFNGGTDNSTIPWSLLALIIPVLVLIALIVVFVVIRSQER